MNIEDVYKEELFNKDYDLWNNFKTRNILCIPIIDQFDKVIGACQAINKIEKLAFESDDIYLLKSLTTYSGIILRNAMQFDESVLLQHNFKQLVIQGAKFQTENNLRGFIIKAEKALCDIFDLAESRVYILRENFMIWYIHT